jgi:ADP-heptose:LPS heptosyltransferase
MATRPSVLFLIRDKLGDSLIAANVALLFARHYPHWSVSVMIREAYAHALANEPDLRVIPYRSGVGASLRAWWWRVTGRRFDVLGVMRGFGRRTMSLVCRIPARRVIAHDRGLAAVATDIVATEPGDSGEEPHHGPAWRVARAIEATLPEPAMLSFPGLTSRWRATTKRYIAFCPISDERRRNIPAEALEALYVRLQRLHPDREVLVLVREADDLKALERAPAIPVRAFHTMPALIEVLLQSGHFYGTDTGLLHLAMAMGMPCTAFFGPTQPHRVLPAMQPDVVALRTPALGERHCDVKACTNAVCITRAVMTFIGDVAPTETPPRPECPLR